MDPFTGLGVAASVVQLGEIAWKVVLEAWTFYKNLTDSSRVMKNLCESLDTIKDAIVNLQYLLRYGCVHPVRGKTGYPATDEVEGLFNAITSEVRQLQCVLQRGSTFSAKLKWVRDEKKVQQAAERLAGHKSTLLIIQSNFQLRGIHELRSEAKQQHTGLSTQISQSFDHFKLGEAQILESISSASMNSMNVIEESEARLHEAIWSMNKSMQRLFQEEAASSRTQSKMYATVQEMSDFLPSNHLVTERTTEVLGEAVTLPIQRLCVQLSAHHAISNKKLDLLLESVTGQRNQQGGFEMSDINTTAADGVRQQNRFKMTMSAATPIEALIKSFRKKLQFIIPKMFECYRGTNHLQDISQVFRLDSTIDQMLSDISSIAQQRKMQLAHDRDLTCPNPGESSTRGDHTVSAQFPEGFEDAMFEDTSSTSSSSNSRYFYSFGSLPSHPELNSFSAETINIPRGSGDSEMFRKSSGSGHNIIQTTTDSHPHRYIGPLPISPRAPRAKIFHKSYGSWTKAGYFQIVVSIFRVKGAPFLKTSSIAVKVMVELWTQAEIQNFGALASYCNLPGPFGTPQISRNLSSFAIRSWSDWIGMQVIDGDIEFTRLQFQNGLAAPTDRLSNGTTLLHVAACAARPEMLKFLLDSGADLEGRDNDSRTALDIIHEYAPQALLLEHPTRDKNRLSEQYFQCCLILEGAGCDPSDAYDPEGANVLENFATHVIATKATDLFITENGRHRLREWKDVISPRCMNIDAQHPASGHTILMKAASKDSIIDAFFHMVYLIQLGADITKTAPDGKQALHFVMMRYKQGSDYNLKNGSDLMALLLDAGADPNSLDHKGHSPSDIARENCRCYVSRSHFPLGRRQRVFEKHKKAVGRGNYNSRVSFSDRDNNSDDPEDKTTFEDHFSDCRSRFRSHDRYCVWIQWCRVLKKRNTRIEDVLQEDSRRKKYLEMEQKQLHNAKRTAVEFSLHNDGLRQRRS